MAGEWDGYRIGYTTLLEISLTVVDLSNIFYPLLRVQRAQDMMAR